MKKLICTVVVLMFLAPMISHSEINTLFGKINIPLPSETQINLGSNVIVTPYNDFSINMQGFAFTTEWIRQWDILYLRSGYSSLNTWIPISAGVDVTECLRKAGWDIPTPELLKFLGVEKFSVNFLVSFDPSKQYGKTWGLGIGSDIAKCEKK